MTHTLIPLPYAYDALEPYIDARTMEIHHSKHHQAYVDNLNKALAKHPELEGKLVEELLKNLPSIPEDIRTAVRNHGGGVANHDLFWRLLKKGVPAKGPLVDAITKKFGSFDTFKEEFAKASMGRFGSGWAWLVVHKGELEIISTANQDSPVSEGKTPILTLDVWEHSYYLRYFNRRDGYVKNWWNIVNWKEANRLYEAALKR